MLRFKSWAEIEPTATKAEKRLKQTAEEGKACVCGPDDGIPDVPETWGDLPEERQIRAEVLRHILLSEDGCDTTEKGILLHGAYISGNLDLSDRHIPCNLLLQGCRFENRIFMPRSKWLANLRFRNCAIPSMRAAGSVIDGQLSFTNVAFDNSDGTALHLQNAVVKREFIFRKIPKVAGLIKLSAAHVRTLADDADSWPDDGQIILDGMTYDRLTGPTDARTRLQWLAKTDQGKDKFYPHPYNQLARVLHDMGHEEDAVRVRVALARKLRRHDRAQLRLSRNGSRATGVEGAWRGLRSFGLWIWHGLSLIMTGHGFRPHRSLMALVLLWLLALIPTELTWREGSFAPNSALLLRSPDWTAYNTLDDRPDPPNPAAAWSETSLAGRDWESFNTLAYAADMVIPIVDLGQTDAWAPSTQRGWWGQQLWWLRWLFAAAGWIVTALGAAALTGVIRRE